jgi:hypothetical protein
MPPGTDPANMSFRKALPKEALATASTTKEVTTHGRMFRDLFRIILPIFYGYFIACGFAWFFVLQFLGGLVSRNHADALYLIVPPPGCWALSAIFLGALSSGLPTHLASKAILGDRYDAYSGWTGRSQDMSGKRITVFMAAVCVVGLTLFVAAGLSTWVEFRGDRVVISRAWPLHSATYEYSRVVSLARIARLKAPSGNLVNRPYHAIRFDDGESWTTQEFFYQTDSRRDGAIFALVSDRSGRPVQELNLIDELKP